MAQFEMEGPILNEVLKIRLFQIKSQSSSLFLVNLIQNQEHTKKKNA